MFCYFKKLDIIPFFYPRNQTTPLQGNGCNDQFPRIKNFFQEVFEWIRQALHLSDLVNDDQTG